MPCTPTAGPLSNGGTHRFTTRKVNGNVFCLVKVTGRKSPTRFVIRILKSPKDTMLRIEKLKPVAQPVLSRDQWDFSQCPPDELWDCHFYEFAREGGTIRASVAAWRRLHPGKVFDDWLTFAASAKRGNRPQVFGYEVFNWYPEWPEAPYLRIKESERKRRRRMVPQPVRVENIRNALRIVPLPKLLKEFSEPSPFGTLQLPPQDRLTVKSADGTHETVAFDIDWRHSNGTLRKAFECWLQQNRPPHVPEWKIKGKGTQAEQIKKELKALGASRLLRVMGWKAAGALTARVLPTAEVLFSEQSAWSDAKKCANSVLKRFGGLSSF